MSTSRYSLSKSIARAFLLQHSKSSIHSKYYCECDRCYSDLISSPMQRLWKDPFTVRNADGTMKPHAVFEEVICIVVACVPCLTPLARLVSPKRSYGIESEGREMLT